ncbi:hypothetical protein GCM10027589_00990 [Actinocorallia lasiicapitis]
MASRVLGVAAAAAVAVGAGCAALAYNVASGKAGGYGPEDCPSDGGLCVPALKAADIYSALTGKGYTCAADTCELQIGETKFEAQVGEKGGAVNEIHASVWEPDGEVIASPSSLAFISWFAELPFADYPEVVGDVRVWITRKAEAQTISDGRIAGYRYSLDTSRAEKVSLYLQGVS